MKWWEPGELADAIAAEMNLSESLGLLFFSKPLDAIDPGAMRMTRVSMKSWPSWAIRPRNPFLFIASTGSTGPD